MLFLNLNSNSQLICQVPNSTIWTHWIQLPSVIPQQKLHLITNSLILELLIDTRFAIVCVVLRQYFCYCPSCDAIPSAKVPVCRWWQSRHPTTHLHTCRCLRKNTHDSKSWPALSPTSTISSPDLAALRTGLIGGSIWEPSGKKRRVEALWNCQWQPEQCKRGAWAAPEGRWVELFLPQPGLTQAPSA